MRAGGTVYTAEGAVAPSVPRALKTEEMAGIVAQYRHAAKCAREAGFDGVEMHAANGYLLDQFIRDSTNRREDEYGGHLDNRLRLVLEVTAAVAEVWGGGRVGIRLSPISTQLGDTPLDSDVMTTYGKLLEELNGFHLAYLHFVEGIPGGSRDWPQDVDLDVLRSKFKSTYIGNNGYDLNMAEARVNAGLADFVAIGRPFISNPDLVARLKTGVVLTEPDPQVFYGDGATGLTDWPAAT
jgi:N-ethylmaleimide reductase